MNCEVGAKTLSCHFSQAQQWLGMEECVALELKCLKHGMNDAPPVHEALRVSEISAKRKAVFRVKLMRRFAEMTKDKLVDV